jgi:hypothetical protein
VLLLDLGSFGWFYEWHYRSPNKAFLQKPAAAEKYRADVVASQQRVLPIRGGTGRVNELPPNLSKLWQVPSASGYGPFIPIRVSRLLTMPPHGTVDESWRAPANQALNLMAVRYVIVPPDQIGPTHSVDSQGIRWADNDLAVDIGRGCNPANPENYELSLSDPVRASTIAIVGALACSVQVKDGAEVMGLSITDQEGTTTSYPLQAGRDFSEWAFDCSDVTPTMQHGRAQIFRSYRAQRGSIGCEGHDYVARVQLKAPTSIKHLSLNWTVAAGTFALKKMSALDDSGSIPLTSTAGSLSDTTRWLNAVRSSRLPDGRVFEPARMALVEKISVSVGNDSSASASVVNLSANVMEVKTTSRSPAFLVTSDLFYPGWHVSIDSNEVELYQTNYAFRGVVVPAGNHVVRFEFRPRSFYYGAAISVIALVLLVGCAWSIKKK